MDKFPCTKCGACCRRVGSVVGFPLPVLANGHCSKLVGDECAIYDSRPAICNIGDVPKAYAHMSTDEWLKANADACNAMILADGHGTLVQLGG